MRNEDGSAIRIGQAAGIKTDVGQHVPFTRPYEIPMDGKESNGHNGGVGHNGNGVHELASGYTTIPLGADVAFPYQDALEIPTAQENPRSVLERFVTEPQAAPLGEVATRTDIRSTEGPFFVLPEYQIRYPEPVVAALGNLYREYNEAFRPLVEANREWDTDYQYLVTEDGTPVNGWVQIDMVGLPDNLLANLEHADEAEAREVVRASIFEIENSLAMYQLLENVFRNGDEQTLFDHEFRTSLDVLRAQHGKKIALLAVTDQKYRGMLESEFGKRDDEGITDEEVHALSGFDTIFSPVDFLRHLDQNGGVSDYLLYARTSDPIDKLKKPNVVVDNPLLANDTVREIIKANAITFNVDNPAWEPGDPRRINDTKGYLAPMGMAFSLSSESDLFSREFAEYLRQGNPYADYDRMNHLSPALAEYIRTQGIDPLQIGSGAIALRFKPLQGTYGCYGHFNKPLSDVKFRQELRKSLRTRGPYVVQPEMTTPVIENTSTGQRYTYIDRNFFATDGRDTMRFMGGFRTMMPLDSQEAANGRIHGNGATVWAQIS